MAATTDHQENITYDGNGNILSYFRNGNTSAGKPLDMDKLAYYYAVDGSGNKKNNQLLYVYDTVALATNYTEDIDRQSVGNYEYDSIGNLTRDNAEKISAITWNVYGKISQITKNTSTVVGDLQLIRYGYDASGNRIRKTVYYNQDATNYRAAHTWYVRDASGNVMATYTSAGLMPKTSTRDTTSKVPLYLSELHMYGSSRLGIWSRNVNMDVLPTGGGTVALLGSAGIDTFNRGNKFFELSNHLGNVLVTVSDRKLGQSPVNNLYTSFTADVVSATDYAPFGMQTPGRSFDAAGSTAYRYGFNGKEKDDEVKGSGAQYDYGFRIYDARLGKFLSVDPLTKSYPQYTPYQFAGNKPIMAIDLDGLEEWVAIFTNGSNKPTTFRFAPELKPLSAGQIYKHSYDLKTGATASSVYDVNKNAVVNLAFIPNDALVKKDVEHEGYLSAYKYDADFFKGLDANSENFAAIGVSSLEDMVFKGVSYAMENNVSIKDAIVDFHGTQHFEKRTDGRPHKLDFGTTELQVDANGIPSNYNEKYSQLIQLLGKFRSEGSQTLMGACNANKCTEVLKKIAKDGRTTVYGHKSYSYSSNLSNGIFYGGILNWMMSQSDGNSSNQGKYIKVDPNGTATSINGVQFSTQSQTAGSISPVPEKKDR